MSEGEREGEKEIDRERERISENLVLGSYHYERLYHQQLSRGEIGQV